MSKIICDVCGTSYPDTATQCPICGCVRPGDANVIAGDTNEPEALASGTYTYVKGGRFSKSNVKKRMNAKKTSPEKSPAVGDEPKQEKGKGEKGLTVAIILLLVAIVAVVIYIVVNFFGLSAPESNQPDGTTAAETTQQVQTTVDTTVLEIPCTDVLLSKTIIELDKAGAAYLLNVTTTPADTTDVIVFSSSDETVVTVSQDGKVEAVSGGQAVITVQCGEATAECRVVCVVEGETTEPSVEQTYPTDDFKLNRKDFTLNVKGESHVLYSGKIPAELITWTSENESVVTVENGKVVAVGTGYTTVYAEYADVKLSCVVRCGAGVGKPSTPAEPTEGDDTQNDSSADGFALNREDFTLNFVGDSHILYTGDIPAEDIAWVSDDESIATVEDGKVTAVGDGNTTIRAVYNGQEVTCTVRCRID